MVSDHIRGAVTQLGDQMGIQHLELDEDGTLNLLLDDGDVLGVEVLENNVLVSVAIVMDEYNLMPAIEAAMMEVYLALQNDVQLNVGFKEPSDVSQRSALFVTIALNNREVGVDTLYEALESMWDVREVIKGI